MIPHKCCLCYQVCTLVQSQPIFKDSIRYLWVLDSVIPKRSKNKFQAVTHLANSNVVNLSDLCLCSKNA